MASEIWTYYIPSSWSLFFTVKSNVALRFCEIVPDTFGTVVETLNLIASNTVDMLLITSTSMLDIFVKCASRWMRTYRV